MFAPGNLPLKQLDDPRNSARAAGLRYVTDEMPGIRRERSGGGFRYRYPTGDLVTDAEVLKRIKSLVIPPAWSQVWICPDPCGHLQATGRDDRARKQSRYHSRWREIRDDTKYARLLAFGKTLARLRRQVEADLSLRGLPRDKVLATVVRLLELSLIRIGNEEYARENESFGLTTLHARHVQVNGSQLRFHFRGKAGKWHDVDVRDRRLARIVATCQELPGQELFQYVDEQGSRQPVNSEDVNDYLRKICGQEFTAKDFRTWAGTVLAAMALRELEKFESPAQARKNIVRAVEAVAARLGNTTSVCRKCYIHPEIIESYQDGALLRALKHRTEKVIHSKLSDLQPEEAAVLGLLQQRLGTEQQRLEQNLRKSLKRVRSHRRRRGRLRSK